MTQLDKKIILASASPRRRELMLKAGYDFEVVVSGIDESKYKSDGLTTSQYAEMLALEKAKDVSETHPDNLVIGADTIADFDGEIIGKAEDKSHAEKITRKLFSKPHKIITGLAFVRLSDGIEIVTSDITTVYPKKMSEAQISSHIKSGTWKDKAGAYAIQETGDKFVEKINGSLTNVMGLPIELLNEMLAKIKEN